MRRALHIIHLARPEQTLREPSPNVLSKHTLAVCRNRAAAYTPFCYGGRRSYRTERLCRVVGRVANGDDSAHRDPR